MKEMIKYIDLIDEGEEVLNKDVWIVRRIPPDTPYCIIKVKLIGIEKQYVKDRVRKNKPKKKSWLRFFNLGV